HPLGPWLNPSPLWEMLASIKSKRAHRRPFCLPAPGCCACVTSLGDGSPAWTRDRTGLVHFAVPLALGPHKVGALVAGQVFDRSPDRLALEPVARELGLSAENVWQLACRERVFRRAPLEQDADLLATLGQAILQGR